MYKADLNIKEAILDLINKKSFDLENKMKKSTSRNFNFQLLIKIIYLKT